MKRLNILFARKEEQDRQSTYNVTQRRVLVTIVGTQKQ